MAIVFDENLNKKIKKYCYIVGKQYGHGGDLLQQITKEAQQLALIKLFKHSERNKVKKINDGFLFIAAKRAVYDYLLKQKAKKRSLYLDSHTILLDSQIAGKDFNLEILDETTTEDYINSKDRNNKRYDELISRIDDKLKSKELKDYEKKIFIYYFLDNFTQKEVAKLMNLTLKKISDSVRHIKVVMQYDFEFDGKEIRIIKYDRF